MDDAQALKFAELVKDNAEDWDKACLEGFKQYAGQQPEMARFARNRLVEMVEAKEKRRAAAKKRAQEHRAKREAEKREAEEAKQSDSGAEQQHQYYDASNQQQQQ